MDKLQTAISNLTLADTHGDAQNSNMNSPDLVPASPIAEQAPGSTTATSNVQPSSLCTQSNRTMSESQETIAPVMESVAKADMQAAQPMVHSCPTVLDQSELDQLARLPNKE